MYYKPCRELDVCNELIEKYFNIQQYEKCFEGHLALEKCKKWNVAITEKDEE